MEKSTLFLLILLASTLAYLRNTWRARTLAETSGQKLHSLPGFYGYYTALWCALPGLLLLLLWLLGEGSILTTGALARLPQSLLDGATPEQIQLLVNDIKSVAQGSFEGQIDPAIQVAADRFSELTLWSRILLTVLSITASLSGLLFAQSRINTDFRARNQVETVVRIFLIGCALTAIFTTIGIVLSVLIESIRFFNMVPITDFLFGLKWSPQIAMRADQAGSSGAFGVIPLLTGIPTVVYGFFAALVVAPFLRNMGAEIGLEISSESALAAGLVMGIMIIPFVSSLSDDFINAVPQSLRDGAYALGATQSETIRQVVIPAALPGIVGGILLAASRAIGETMIVVMAAGLSANLTLNPLAAVTTVTTQIVTLLVGDQEFDSPKTLAAFALGLILFILTLCLNIMALRIVRKYREQYE